MTSMVLNELKNLNNNADNLITKSLVRRNNFGPYYKIKEDDLLIKNNDRCTICLENYKSGTYKRILSCNHIYHKKCIDRWFKTSECQTCPMCRKRI